MKDKTHSMNADYSSSGSVAGFEKIPNSEVPQRRTYKNNQLKDANLLDDTALSSYENRDGDEPGIDRGGFLKRNNYSERY